MKTYKCVVMDEACVSFYDAKLKEKSYGKIVEEIIAFREFCKTGKLR